MANTGLPDGEQPMADIWWLFREAITTAPQLNIGWFVQGGCRQQMSDEVRRLRRATSWSFCVAEPELLSRAGRM